MTRELADLPYARHLVPLAQELAPEGDYDCVHIDGDTDFDDVHLPHARFTESAFTGLVVNGGSMRHTRFVDVWQRGVRWIGTELADTSWQDTEAVDGAMSGVDLGGATLRRVRFVGCKFDSVNFRSARLREVTFTECVLRDCDFGGARVHRTSFPQSEVGGMSLHGAELNNVDFRGAARLDIAEGIEAMRGAIVSPMQLMELAPALALATGIIVRD
ncbi:pentapeptide repeat-containing protein [Nocardia callitridis]|uniref:Pentapeptide repeat-containing protein n=1 Tax=Nocardia callitridis TaxID=648753 RepID=A0ABP9K6F3_9NOCA